MAFQAVDVRLRDSRPITTFDTCGVEVEEGDYVVVENDGLKDCGQVVHGPYQVEEEEVAGTPGPVLYKASAEDVESVKKAREREKEARGAVRDKVRQFELPMKLISCEFACDLSKLKVVYTADKRIDFRELVRDLAHDFRTRIEMKQIGVRDGAGITGGFGDCGRTLCCSDWLRDFKPISVKMAKEQGLALNPSKITGMCGRLKCCLSYEVDHYRECRHRFPRPGTICKVKGQDASGPVRSVNILRESVTLQVQEQMMEVPLAELEPTARRQGGRPRRGDEGKPQGEKTEREEPAGETKPAGGEEAEDSSGS
jgi:cell fate regulator YaaT (PSP1 superfamily)